ncbi:MAG TPA: hypothetical protein VK527_03465 [Candidatus Limnocylindrales bacterium]|nr:hypothetical protein [Candidatus Limnocylindrales bacterium]
MNFSLSSPPNVIALVLLAGALAFGLAVYLTRYPVLPPRRRALLVAIRTVTLLALLFASLAPVVRYSSASRERNRMLVLVDHSGSMEVRDGDASGRTRREVADSAAAAIASALSGRYDVRLAPFDAALGPIGKASTWKKASEARGAGETALGDALREALDRMDPDSLAAILVLSDGAVNRGEDPERVLESSVPAFGLVAGSASDPPTTGIGGIDVPAEVVIGRPASLTVTIRHGSRPATRGVARLSEGSRELGRAAFALDHPGTTARVTIPFTVGERGKHFLTVRLDSLPGDPITQNKRRLIAVTARPAKRIVPLLATAWDWDLRSFTRGVEEDTSWAIQRLAPSGPAAVTLAGGGSQSLAQALRDADVAVVRLDSRTLTPERSAEILRFLERGGGVLFWTDPVNRPPAPGALTNALGLEWRDFNHLPGPSTGVELTPAGRAHETSLLGGDAATATTTWNSLPPIQTPVILNVKGGALAPLLLARFGTEATPLLLAGRIGGGRVAVLNASGVYRWGLTAAGLSGGAGIEPTFFGGLATWLSQSADDRPVRIVAPDLTPAERPIPVRLALSNAALASGARATVRARRAGAGGVAAQGSLAASAQGDFAGSISLPEGIYTLQGRVERGGRVIGMDSVRVAVGEQGVEFESLGAEPEVIERLASRSGGMAAPLGRPGPVLAKLRSPDIAKARMVELDIFHNVALFVVLVLGATAEWIMRKRFHLL